MQIFINGQAHPLPAATTVAALLESLGLAGRRLAVEINHEIVPKSAHGQHQLRDGDRIELVQAMGGG